MTIESIHYNTRWTNQAVTLQIQTSSDAYDQILVNQQESVSITENGLYTIQAMKDSVCMDEREIEITNIDVESPNGTSEYSDGKYILYVYDNASQINYQTIRYY